MCERTYVACGGCDAPVAGNVELIGSTVMYESWSEGLDEDGDPTGDREYGDSEPGEDGDSHYVCRSCGWDGHNLDMECSSNECDCAECEPDIDNFSDPDEICALVRRLDNGNIPERDEPWPPEIEKLLTNRLIHFIPITRSRAAQIADECSGELAIDFDPCVGDPFTVDTSMEITPRAIEQLSVDHVAVTNSRLQLPIPNTREEVADVPV